MRQTIAGLDDYVYGLSFVEENRLVSLGHTGGVYLWNAADGAPLGSMKLPAFALQFALSPDGRRLAAGCVDARAYVVNISDAAK